MGQLLNESVMSAVGGMGFGPMVDAAPGQNFGMVYAALPFNNNLQQKANETDNSRYIHVGSLVRGVGANNENKHFTGQVMRIVKDMEGEIAYLYIKTLATNKFVTILADDNLELIIFKDPKMKKPVVFPPSYNIGLH